MRCWNCNQEVPENTKYCPHCRNIVKTTTDINPDIRNCKFCGKPAEKGKDVCDLCEKLMVEKERTYIERTPAKVKPSRKKTVLLIVLIILLVAAIVTTAVLTVMNVNKDDNNQPQKEEQQQNKDQSQQEETTEPQEPAVDEEKENILLQAPADTQTNSENILMLLILNGSQLVLISVTVFLSEKNLRMQSER